MAELRICCQSSSRKIYNEGWCGEFKTYTLPARTIKMYGSTLNLKEGCNRCRAKLLKEVAREQNKRAKLNFRPPQLRFDFIEKVKVGSHWEKERWTDYRGKKHVCNTIVVDYTSKYSDCLPGKAWLKEHEHDIDKYPEPLIELSVNGKDLSLNGDYKPGMIKNFVKANKTLPIPVINERREEKMSQQTKNKKRRQVLDFARDNNLVIHPGRGFEYYTNNFFEVGHCPCAKERLDCPCPESIEEVGKDGWCLCRLYWRDLDTYKESHVPAG